MARFCTHSERLARRASAPARISSPLMSRDSQGVFMAPRAWASLARQDKLKLISRGACFSLPAGLQPGRARPKMLFNRAAISLRKDFNRHLLAADIVRDIFGDHRELVFSGAQFGHAHLTGIRASLPIPTQIHRGSAVQPRDDGARGGRRADAEADSFTSAIPRLIEMSSNYRRMAGDNSNSSR